MASFKENMRWPWLASQWWEHWMAKRPVRWTLRVCFAATVTILLAQLNLDPLEFVLYDIRAGLSPAPEASGNVVLISIDDQTLQELKRNPSAGDFATALTHLKRAEPRYTVSLLRPSEFLGPIMDVDRVVSAAKATSLIFAENEVPAPGQTKFESLPPPYQFIPVEPAPITRDHSPFASRGVTRRVIIEYQGLTLQARLAMAYNGLNKSELQGRFQRYESEQAYVRFKSDFPRISFVDLLRGNFDTSILRGKIALIGRESDNVRNTYLTVASSFKGKEQSPLEIQGSYIDSLITNSSARLTPLWCTALLTFVLSVLTMLIVMKLRPVTGLMALVMSVSVVILASQLLYWAVGLFFPVAAPMFGIVTCYYFILPYRLILENRKSWEYAEKNRLLTQVEELKSNFIRLMSHDLKTPLARIQAMAEIVTQEQERLSEEQVQALGNITSSAEDLSQFIQSILSLSRIQSQKVKLDLKTRDINQLLQRVIKTCEHLARRKSITVVTDFEPLFSLKMDEELMRQVFTNLIENAIKYSPENTTVKISASEIDGRIRVQVADQGIGIPKDEIPFVFERFYRAQNAEYENNGTGLGLYLAKYFVGLHGGTIGVQSEADAGSTFSVNLPLELEENFRPPGGIANV